MFYLKVCYVRCLFLSLTNHRNLHFYNPVKFTFNQNKAKRAKNHINRLKLSSICKLLFFSFRKRLIKMTETIGYIFCSSIILFLINYFFHLTNYLVLFPLGQRMKYYTFTRACGGGESNQTLNI